MPIEVVNKLVVTGPSRDLQQFAQENFEEDELSFNLSVTRPVNLSGWDEHDWNIMHWGTTRDANDHENTLITKNKVKTTFITAWEPPRGWIKEIAVKYPRLKIVLRWCSEEFPNCGIIVRENGLLVKARRFKKKRAECFRNKHFPEWQVVETIKLLA